MRKKAVETVPVAGRVSPSIKKNLIANAERIEVSLSEMVGIVISDSINNKSVEESKCDVLEEKWHSLVGELIPKFSDNRNKQQQMLDFVTNQINND